MKFSTAILTAIFTTLVAASPEREVTVLAPEKRDVNVPDYIKKFKGTTYTPFDQNHNCRTADQIKTDVSALNDFSLLRLYSNDCDVIQHAASVFNGQLIVAVNNINSVDEISADLYNIATAIGNAGKQFNDVVHTVVVGNELVYNSWFTASEVGNFISQAKSVFPAFPGKWISADTISSYYGNPELCEYNDYIGVNSHPFFDDSTAENAGEYVLSHVQAVWQFCHEHGHDKDVINLETGWPWKGEQLHSAIPSSENQVTAVKAIAEKAGDASILYSAYNDLWKDDGPWNVEKNWGNLGNAPSSW